MAKQDGDQKQRGGGSFSQFVADLRGQGTGDYSWEEAEAEDLRAARAEVCAPIKKVHSISADHMETLRRRYWQ